jgi:P-type E1-E2 ATPase
MHRSKIVPGDIIQISSGMEIPADCILLKGIHVIVNESAITGESQ